MKPLALLALLATAPVAAQTAGASAGDPSGPTMDSGLDRGLAGRPFAATPDAEDLVVARFEADLADLARLATAAALVHERTGAFPETAFGLLGAPEAAQTGARAFPLSELDVSASAGSVVLRYVPLPVSPYVREDLVVTATVRPDGPGRYAVEHEMRRRSDPEDGGRGLLYDRAGTYRVERGFGRLCVEAAAARAMIAAGAFEPDPDRLAPGEFTVRLHAPGPDGEVFYETARDDERP